MYSDYFEKCHFQSYMYDLSIIQKRIGYKVNKEIYDYDDYEFLISYHDYLKSKEKDFAFLFGKYRKERLREIAKEVEERKNCKKYVEIRNQLLNELNILSTKKYNKKIFNKFYNKFLKRA